VDWLNSKLSVQRGIVRQRVGDVKTIYSNRKMSISAEMLEVLKLWKQTTQFSKNEDWMFASPAVIGRNPWAYDTVLRAFQKAAKDAGIGTLGTHTMRHSYRSWLDSVGTPIAVQQKLMRHADIRTTMNVYGDVVTDEMSQASGKITRLALTAGEWQVFDSKSLKSGGSEWESNPPSPSEITIYGFEDRESHRTPCASKSSCQLSATRKTSHESKLGFRGSINIIEEIRENPGGSAAQVLAQSSVNYFG